MRRSMIVLALVLGSLLFTSPSPAQAPEPALPAATAAALLPGAQGSEETGIAAGAALSPTKSFNFLPVVLNNYSEAPPCTVESPFSLEIAAISQIRPAGEQVATAEAEAEWLARIEEGFPTLVEAFAESGACWTRIEISWRKVEPDSPGTRDWTFFDEKLGLLAESGVLIMAIIDKVPDWAGPHERGPIDAEDLGHFQAFLAAVVDRYGKAPHNIRHWELFNEADWVGDSNDVLEWGDVGWGFMGDEYVRMLREAAHPVIKGVDPGATILMGGLAYDAFEEYRIPYNCTTCPFNRYFPDKVMEEGGDAYLDVVNFHYFPDYHEEWEQWSPPPPTCGEDVHDGVGLTYSGAGVDLIAKANHFRNRLKVCYGVEKPVWVTELGEHGVEGDADSLAQQSRYVLQGYARGLAAGVENITWFTLVSPPYDPYDQGLLNVADWSPKPAYYTYQTLTYELAGYAYDYTASTGDVEAYVFSREKRADKTVAWSTKMDGEDPPGELPAPLTFNPASRLLVIDRLGGSQIIYDGGTGDEDGEANGEITLELTHDPVIVSH